MAKSINNEVYVVSLKDSVDRRKSIINQCEKLDTNPIFIDAVNGKDLTKSEISQYCNQNKAKQLFGRELLLGEIGCALSHKKIHQKMVDENIPYAVILEDDAVVKEGFNEVVSLVYKNNLSWHIILLGHYRGFEHNQETNSIDSIWSRYSLNKTYRLGKIVKGGLGTHGYIISQEGAKQILDFLEYDELYLPIDKITSNNDIVKVYGLSPVVITIANQFNSLIENTNSRGNDRDGELVYEIAKLLKKTPFFNITRALWFTALKIKPIKPIKKYK